ncbi:MAG: hypothetical protein AMXMBFR7_15760 [Planctomycetota bacterium]
MLHQHAQFLKGPRIEQRFDAFARGQLAFGVLSFHAFGSTAGARDGAAALEFLQTLAMPGGKRRMAHGVRPSIG